MEIVTERVNIPAEGGSFGGYVARPADGGPSPAVVVFMEIFGINSHIRDVCERLAREGYVVAAPDYFHRTHPGFEVGYDDAGFAKGMEALNALDADQMIADTRATLAYLRGRSDVRGDRIGAMGFCIGGHMTYLAACETDVAAAASFYGGGVAGPQGPGGKASTVGRTSGIRGRLLCLFGGKDAFIPLDQVEAVRQALKEAGTDHEVVVYDDCDHGFFCDQRDSYDANAAGDAWERVKKLFSETLG